MRILRWIERVLDTLLQTAILGLVTGLIVTVSWQVFSRYILNKPSTSTDELARFMLVWLVLLGAAYCVGKKSHLAIDLLSMGSSIKIRRWFNLYVDLMILGFTLFVMVYGGFRLLASIASSNGISPAMQMPLEYLFMILPVSGLLMAAYSTLSVMTFLITRFEKPGLASQEPGTLRD